jgi:hypothetical protein
MINNIKTMTGYTCFTYLDQLDEKTTKELDEIVLRKTEDSEKGMLDSLLNKNNDKTSHVTIKSSKSDTTKKVLNIALDFFKNAGINVSENHGDISYISYNHNSLNYTSYDDFVGNLYCINDAYQNEHYHECIIVTKKGENLKDGNMEVYKKNPVTLLSMFGYEEEEKNVYELNTGTVLVFKGDTLHKLQAFKGDGFFNFIVVSLRDMQCLSDYNKEY